MYDYLKNILSDKKVLLLGFGREGQSTYRLLKRIDCCKSIAIADKNTVSPPQGDAAQLYIGSDYQACLEHFDIVIKSPGIVLERDFASYHCRITSQTELFLEYYRGQTIGITGTKGKSTTATLLSHVLSSAGISCVLAGNIGIPLFDILEELTETTTVVCELSCHQLEYTQISPHTAVLLNIHEEHLDHYGTFAKYKASKENIYRFQNQDDVLYCNLRNLPSTENFPGTSISVAYREDTAFADILIEDGQFSYRGHTLPVNPEHNPLHGRHNLFNIGIVYAICTEYGISDDAFLEALSSYRPLPHRLEFIGDFEGVRYFDDSISTICDTTIQALNSLPETETVLIGGMDRGIDYSPLIQFLNRSAVPYIILMEATGRRILKEIQQDPSLTGLLSRTYPVGSLKDAVISAKRLTRPGAICLLSPAAASYGIFRNFEERGDCFKALVQETAL